MTGENRRIRESASTSMAWVNGKMPTAKPFTPVQFRAWPPSTAPTHLSYA
jgi:hypothetical protein